MISVQSLSKSFVIPHLHKRSVKGSLFSLFDRKTYEVNEVLKDFSLEVKSGEIVGIMGPNGSGKSTLLKIIAGVYEPDEGTITIEGKVTAILELGVGFHPELSAWENVLMNGLLLGLSREHLRREMKEIFRFAELESFMDMPLKHYSSGMAARLAFAVAMQVDADVYLLDEVLAVGDQAFQEKCLGVFRELQKKGKTVLLVSHSEELMNQLCDRVFSLSR
ncbi:MAG: ABC transporter ATP-binding protein [bacterium]|nr:ABC transporter ATP-binding protein [bacterium]